MAFRDAILGSGRTAAGSPRVLAGALFALAFIGGALLENDAKHTSPRPAPKHAVHHRATVKPLALHKPAARKVVPPKPAPPSAFALEQAMSYRQLLERWSPQILAASKRFKISALWIRAVMEIESGGRTMLDANRKIVSPAGAMGLMQLMPKTWSEMRASYRLGVDPFDPHDNIFAGAAYLKQLYLSYGYPTMFAAYNDGPGMLAAHAALHQPPPAETESYVRDIASILGTGVRYRAGSTRNLARLTRPDGAAVMIDAGAVVSLRPALPGEYAASVQSVIGIGRLRQGVREPPARARAILRGHGALI